MNKVIKELLVAVNELDDWANCCIPEMEVVNNYCEFFKEKLLQLNSELNSSSNGIEKLDDEDDEDFPKTGKVVKGKPFTNFDEED